ncbi:MAG: HAMP domain-containing histidine kinase [Planctomycetes bacterium]|nr:HAMP domain-containing histidine kinase [Planctomycetota bacterium]
MGESATIESRVRSGELRSATADRTMLRLAEIVDRAHAIEDLARMVTDALAVHWPDCRTRFWLAKPRTRCQDCDAPEECAVTLGCFRLIAASGPGPESEDQRLKVVRGCDEAVGKAGLEHHQVEEARGGFWQLASPLVARGSSLGVLGVSSRSPLSSGERRFLETASRLVSVALDRSQMLAESGRQSREFERVLLDKTSRLSQQVHDLEDTRVAMLNMMSDAFDSQRQLRSMTERLEDLVAERTREAVTSKEEAERANELKSRFLSRVSHELRTPLHGIISFAKVGIRKIDRASRDKTLNYFRQILESADELLPLINDLLDIARIEAGRFDYDFQPRSVTELVHSVLQRFAALAQENDIKIVPTFDLSGSATAVMDHKTIRQVLTNLVGNALKFSPRGATIEVVGRREADQMIIEVMDRGPGVPESERETIFEAFLQSSVTRNAAEGTGLGLPISRGVARDHGGDLAVEPRRGGGSVFRLSWPSSRPE